MIAPNPQTQPADVLYMTCDAINRTTGVLRQIVQKLNTATGQNDPSFMHMLIELEEVEDTLWELGYDEDADVDG